MIYLKKRRFLVNSLSVNCIFTTDWNIDNKRCLLGTPIVWIISVLQISVLELPVAIFKEVPECYFNYCTYLSIYLSNDFYLLKNVARVTNKRKTETTETSRNFILYMYTFFKETPSVMKEKGKTILPLTKWDT